MDKLQIEKEYKRWKNQAKKDAELARELRLLELPDDNGQAEKNSSATAVNQALEDAFYRNLSFGTGGLRGVLGAGTNRMNQYTVAKASQGLADYVKKHFSGEERRIAVSYDSRIKSDLFAKTASGVFAANGIQVWIYPELMPTPCLSFAVRELGCAAGIMITASHNPSKYNGYKVYGADGCQITSDAAAEILGEIEKLDLFGDVKQIPFEDGVKDGRIGYISEEVYTSYIEHVKQETLLDEKTQVDRDAAIIYTPLNGTGLKPVLRILKESGYTNVTVVKEQEQPDGHFPTCPYPNPEIKEAMELGMQYASQNHADLLLATDPDCDRVGIAVRSGRCSTENQADDYILLSGNETGILLLDYICSRRQEMGTMPADPVAVKTIVTTDMAEQIADHYGVKVKNVLTGFKYIGEQIGLLEAQGKEDSYLFGFEESYGYLSGGYVRDKDAVNGVFLICEMYSYYKAKGIGLAEKLEELYQKYGYCLNTLHSYEFEGAAGFEKMQEIMRKLRSEKMCGEEVCSGKTCGSRSVFGGRFVEQVLDYEKGVEDLPRSNVLKFLLSGNCSVVVRPSGTEPKLKLYISVSAGSRQEAALAEEEIVRSVEGFL